MTLKTLDSIYLFEFKVDSKEKAIEQIREKKYYKKYLSEEKEMYIVGICFDSSIKTIIEFEVEKMS